MDRRKLYLADKLAQLEMETDVSIYLARLFFEDTKNFCIEKLLALRDSREFFEQYPSVNRQLVQRLDHLTQFNFLTETLLENARSSQSAPSLNEEPSHASNSIRPNALNIVQITPVQSTSSHASIELTPALFPEAPILVQDQLAIEDQCEDNVLPVDTEPSQNYADDVKWITLFERPIDHLPVSSEPPVQAVNQEYYTSEPNDGSSTLPVPLSSEEDRRSPLLQSFPEDRNLLLPHSNTNADSEHSCGNTENGNTQLAWGAHFNYLLENPTASSSVDNSATELLFPGFSRNPGTLDAEWVGMVEHIATVSEFYVHIGSPDNLAMDEFHNRVQARYSKTKKMFQSKNFAQVKLGNFCVCYYPEGGGGWYRGQILDWCLGEEGLIVQLVDHGHKVKVTLDMLRPLHNDFKNQPMFAIQCELACVKPPARLVNWPQASSNMFKEEAIKYKTYRIIPVGNEVASATPTSLNHSKAVAVVLIPRTNGVYCGASLNDFLVGCDYAEYDELPPIVETSDQTLNQFQTNSEESEAQNSAVSVSDSNDDVWDPMQEAFDNPYDDENACVAVSGYDAQDESRICRFFAETGECYKGNSCQKEHSFYNRGGYTTDKEKVYVQAFNALSMPASGSTIKIEVTSVLDKKFYAIYSPSTMPSEHDDETLLTLDSELNSRNNVRNLKRLSICPAIGQIVVAQFDSDKKWYRAQVHKTLDAQGMIQVFFVDYGNIASVPEKSVRDIEPRFLHLPFQARMFTLANVDLVEQTQKEAAQHLHNIVANKILSARVLGCCPVTSVIQCNLIDDTGTDIGVLLSRKGYASLIHPTDYIQLWSDQKYLPG